MAERSQEVKERLVEPDDEWLERTKLEVGPGRSEFNVTQAYTRVFVVAPETTQLLSSYGGFEVLLENKEAVPLYIRIATREALLDIITPKAKQLSREIDRLERVIKGLRGTLITKTLEESR